MTLPKTMRAMVTMGHGGLDQLVFHPDWPRPDPGPGEVLIRVQACGLNNTDVNTRSGWYSKTVSAATTGGAYDQVDDSDHPGVVEEAGHSMRLEGYFTERHQEREVGGSQVEHR